MKKIFLILLLSSISLFAVQNQKKIVLQLSWLHQYQFAGYYIAKELGYYKDLGIDVEIKEFHSGLDISTVIEKKEAEFAVGRSSLLIDKINGKDVVALGAIFQNSPLMLMTRDDTGINTIKDLKNKKIMLTSDAKSTASIMAMLFSQGILEHDIDYIQHSFNLDDLVNKKVDAMACYTSNEPIRMQDMGVGYKIFHPKDYGFHFYSDILFTSSEFIQNNPKLTKDFYEASIKGWIYAFEHISETAELIYRSYNTQNKTLIQLFKEGESLKQLSYNKDNRPLGYLNKEQLKEIVNVYKLLGITNRDVDLESFIYEHNHPKEFELLFSYDDIFHVLMIIALLFVTLIAILLFISFRKQWLITQNNLKEKIERQKIKIEEQNRTIMAQSKITAVGDMLNNIAHQWRQPLNIITLNTVKLETAILLDSEVKHESIRQVSQAINEQSQYLSNTIDDFRNYFNSNVDSIESFKLSSAIDSVCGLTRDIFNHNRIEAVKNMDDCLLKHNKSLLIQALLNVYNNAKDALVQDRSEHRYFFVEVECNGENIVIKLKDSAGGIDKDVMTKIFDPYYTTKQKSQGTGLGLYITYEIITKHFGGSVEVYNRDYRYMENDHKGAEFIITIPYEQNLTK